MFLASSFKILAWISSGPAAFAGFSDVNNVSTPFDVIFMSSITGWFALTWDLLWNMKLLTEFLRDSGLFCINTDWNWLFRI